MKVIEDKGKLISIIYRADDWPSGVNFITPKSLFVQVASMVLDKGKIIPSHIHKEYAREIVRTHEVIYVVQGSVKVFLYTDEKTFLHSHLLEMGDMAVYANGGHGYEILEDDTRVIELKNGPYIDVATDKEKF